MNRAAGLLDPADPPALREARLLAIADALIRRAEQSPDNADLAYSQFERAALLEAEVEARTRDLGHTLDLLQESNARLERATREAEAARSNLAQAIETIEGGFAMFDPDDRLVMHNSRFCADLEDVARILHPGLSFEGYVEAISRSDGLAVPEGMTRAGWAARRMRRHGDASTSFDVALARDRWIQVSEQRTAGGGTVVLQTDVTALVRRARREREQAVDRQARVVRATLDHLAQAVAVFERTGHLAGCNAEWEAMVGQVDRDATLSDLLDRLERSFEFGDGIDRAGLEAWAARARARRPLSFEMRRRAGAGRPAAIYDVFANEMPEHGFVVSLTDVTAERRAADALRDLAGELEARVAARTEELDQALQEARRANASKSRFVAAASHDLLQPLSAAKLFVGALEEGAADGEARDLAGRAITALGSVETLIEALLDIARLDSGRAEMDEREVPLAPIFDSLRTELTPAAAARGQVLRVVSTGLQVRSDPVFLRRIVQNLLGNAVRHSTGGRILLCARRAGPGRVRIEVRDAGPGIAPDDQAVIFEEFRRLGRRSGGHAIAEGLGLGLAIVERACARLGHDLSLRSEPGRGSTFAVTLPAAAPAAPAPRDDGAPAAPPRDLVIGLVENEAVLADALVRMIEGWGSDVIHAPDGEAALALLGELGIVPDVFLIDRHLGDGMDGLAFLAALRDRHGPVPAAVVSADRSPELARACAAFGVPLVPKPIDRAKLAATIHAIAAPPAAG